MALSSEKIHIFFVRTSKNNSFLDIPVLNIVGFVTIFDQTMSISCSFIFQDLKMCNKKKDRNNQTIKFVATSLHKKETEIHLNRKLLNSYPKLNRSKFMTHFFVHFRCI